MHLPFDRPLRDNRTGIEREALTIPVEQGVAQRFSDSIDHFYRSAISLNPTPRNQIAYGCYLAEHGHFIEAMHEFDETLEAELVSGDGAILAEIVHHIAMIEHRFEADDSIGRTELASIENWSDENAETGKFPDDRDDEDWNSVVAARESAEVIQQMIGEVGQRPSVDLGATLAGLDPRTLHDVRDLLTMLWADRMACEQRRSGLILLKLALFCGKYNLCGIEVACIRKAIRCFEQAAKEIRGYRLHFVTRPAICHETVCP